MKYRALLSLVMLLGVTASGCVGAVGDGSEGDEEVGSTEGALTNDGVWMGSATGNVYTSSGGIGYGDIQSNHIFNAMRDSSWPTSAPKAYSIIDWADWENYGANSSTYGVPGTIGLCGATARNRYNAASGSAWCTEYARWVLRQGGLRDIRYCKTSFIGCLDYGYLSEARTVNDMVQLFTANGGWVNRASLSLDVFKPGNYLALMSNNLHKNHSAIIMAASADHNTLYTSEGNVDDCVRYMVRPIYVNGAFNPEFDGVGKASVAF